MLIGQKGVEIEILAYPRALRAKNKGFTLVEILVVTFVLMIIISALTLTLTRGEFFNEITSAKTDLQSEVRRVMDWIVKDVRQTYSTHLNSNGPTEDHVKFKTVKGIKSDGGHDLDDNFIEYDYDGVTQQLTRNEVNDSGVVLRSWVFDDITQSPFWADTVGVLWSGTSGKLIIVIAGQKQVRGVLNINFSLTEEVKFRNE